MIVDVVVASVVSLLAFLIYFVPRYGGVELGQRYVLLGIFCGVVLVQIGRTNDWYRVKQLISFRDRLASLFFGWSFATLMVATAIFLLKLGDEFSRGWFILFWLFGFSALTLSRFAIATFIARLQDKGALRRRTVVIGTSDRTEQLLQEMQDEELSAQYAIVSVFAEGGETANARTMPADMNELADLVTADGVDLIIIAAKPDDMSGFNDLIDVVSELPVDVWLTTDILSVPLARRSFDLIGSVPALTVAEKPLKDWSLVTKRTIDLIVASLLLLFFAPLFAIVGIAIKLTSPGPVIFHQQRFGFGGRPIEVLKFRSMRVDCQDVSGERKTVRNDHRVTPVGRFIRRTSIDELPQLINVLRGDMSIVGPRAHPIAMKVGDQYYHSAVRRYAGRHRMLPGITGWAQVNGSRGEIETMDQACRRLEFDLYYIENWSLAFDLKILVKTLACVVYGGRHAY